MIRNDRDKIAEEIAKIKDMKLIQAQNIIDLFLRLAYEEGYVVIKAKQFYGEEYGRTLQNNMSKIDQEEARKHILSEKFIDDI